MGCQVIGIRKSEFAANTHFLYRECNIKLWLTSENVKPMPIYIRIQGMNKIYLRKVGTLSPGELGVGWESQLILTNPDNLI